MEDLEEEQDVTAWVNGVLSEASADGASVDAKISSVSMKLQIMAADLNDELEGHMEELIEAAPRALGDVGSVSRALGAVDEELAAVQRRVDGASRGGREVRTLDELDRLKTHLEAVGATLREAASWQAAARRAAASLDAFLNRGAEAREPWDAAAGDVAAQLATMGDSERILRKLPDADDRRSTLDSLRDDFEHALRPRVAAALAAPDVSGEALRPLVALYERLGLGEALRRDYAAARPGAARKRWFARTAADDAGLDLAPWLGAFLDDLLRDLEAEKAAAGAAFGEAHAPGVAALVAAETLKPLAESFRGKLDAAADRGPGGLEDCAAAHAACGVFLENLEQTLGLPAQSPLLGDVAFAVGGAPFAGFGEMGSDGATRYGALERRRFAAAVAVGAADCRAALDALPADGLLPAAAFEAALDRARKLLDAALADDCRAALGRCAALTGGLDGAGCAAAVRDATRDAALALAAVFGDLRGHLVLARRPRPCFCVLREREAAGSW